MASTLETLEKGQVPHEQLLRIRTAHDVRRLEGCAHCNGIGHRDSMVLGFPYANDYFHGRCFVAAHGIDALLDMPEQAAKLSLGDLGFALMTKLLDASQQKGRK
jgi:hypothetical protein